MSNHALLTTGLDLPLSHRGKVRDIYELDGKLLIVATDRLSAFDVVFNEGIPDKGRILTAISCFWADTLVAARPYHLVTADVERMGPRVAKHAGQLCGRSMLVERLEMLPVECVVRGHLVGSGWKDYLATGQVCGHTLPAGLRQGEALAEPLFTPATKAAMGEHDQNISFDQMCDLVGASMARALRDRSLALFQEARAMARQRGLVLVDTKLEFGQRADGTLVLADEVLTPDSSRYWDAAEAAGTPCGVTPPSYDKQVVRDYLETLSWDKQPPPPPLPPHIVAQAAKRYQEILARLRLPQP